MGGATGIALIGAGYWGNRLARNLACADGCELRHVCDVDPERAQLTAEAYAAFAATSLATVLDDASVAAVLIATPASTHERLVAQAIDAGRHVLVEKPLARSSAEARRLGARAAAEHLVVMCDQTYRFATAVSVIREQLAAPDFGPVRTIESVRVNCGHDQPDVDVFWDLAYHDLAILDAMIPGVLGDELEARAESRDIVGIGRPHQGELSLTWRTGLSARIFVDWHGAAKVRTMRVSGDEHRVTWNDLAPGGSRVRRDNHAVRVEEQPEPLGRVVAEFLAAIAEERDASCGPAEEIPVLAVLEAATRSASLSGAPVVVTPAESRATDFAR